MAKMLSYALFFNVAMRKMSCRTILGPGRPSGACARRKWHAAVSGGKPRNRPGSENYHLAF
ncbi:hypothetical protein NN6n1_05910 [Shinella zoogloeoides]